MLNNKKILGVVTARAGSKGLPGKNLRPLLGRPLIAWTIEQGLASRYIDKLIVSTDSHEIANIARHYKAEVPFIRPSELSTDAATSLDVVEHALDFFENASEKYDFLVLLEPTSPLRAVSDIDGAIELCESLGEGTSVVSVAAAENTHPAFLFSMDCKYLKPMLDRTPNGLRRQDLKTNFFYVEGSVYVSPVSLLRTQKSFYHSQTAPWIVERYKSVEIDELSDFIIAEALMLASIEGRLH